jgi:predicted ABC-type ATPase
MTPQSVPIIFVLAGVNGAGKTSIGGDFLRKKKSTYFNPDEAARTIRLQSGCSMEEANAQAWQEGKERLESAIARREEFAFESTLGGNTIPRLLREAAEAGLDVFVWFVGLSSPEQHLARVRARVMSGGHDIPEAKIRERWDGSRRNIIALLPALTELRVFDNSRERDPISGDIPPPRLLLHWRGGAIVAPALSELETTPEWARPIVARALKLQRAGNDDI